MVVCGPAISNENLVNSGTHESSTIHVNLVNLNVLMRAFLLIYDWWTYPHTMKLHTFFVIYEDISAQAQHKHVR